MESKLLLFIRYCIIYFAFLFVLKNIHAVLFISFDSLLEYWFVFIPIAYFVVKYLIYYDVEKYFLLKREVVFLAFCFTVINIFFSMPYVYSISVLVFLFICKDKKVRDMNVISKNINEYYSDKNL